jgi:hypothetical protein
VRTGLAKKLIERIVTQSITHRAHRIFPGYIYFSFIFVAD